MPITDLKIRLEKAPKIEPEIDQGSPLAADPVPEDYGEAADTPTPPPPPRRRSPSAAVPTITKAMEREVREEIEAIVTMAALMWSVPDPVCGPVLSDQSRAIATSLTALLRRNPRLLASLRAAGWMGEWVQLAMAVGPVVNALYHHHIATGEDQEDTDHGDITAPRLADYPAFIPRPGAYGAGNPVVA